MLLKKSASLAQRHLKAMIEFSNSHTHQQRLHQSTSLGGTQRQATRCSLTIETMEFALNFASRQVDFALRSCKMNLPKFKQKNVVFVKTECSLLGHLLKAID